MFQFSSRINIPPSPTLHINSLALEKKRRGERVYNVSAGEPLMQTPEVIVAAARDAIGSGKTHYSPVQGIPELVTALQGYFFSRYGATYTPDEICVTNGGKFGLYGLCQVLLEPGDEALIIAPYWVSYDAMTRLAGGVPIIIPTSLQNKWKVTKEQLAAVKTPRTKILFFNNASNPTGVLYTKEELRDILSWAYENNVFVISDEVYSGLVYDGNVFASAALFREYAQGVAVVESASKNFAMTGWRLGSVSAPAPIIHAFKVLQGQSTSNTSTISQWAAVAAYTHHETLMPIIQKEMQDKRDAFVREWTLSGFPEVDMPGAGLYVFFPLLSSTGSFLDDVTWCAHVLDRCGVAAVPGSAFGAPGFVRFSFGGDIPETTAALHALKDHGVL